MTDSYFGTDAGAQEGASGSFVQWDALAAIEALSEPDELAET